MGDLWISVNRRQRLATVIDEDALLLLEQRGVYTLWTNVTSGHNRARTTRRYVMAEWYEDGRKKRMYLHRLLMGVAPGESVHVDHIDNDPFNNRRSNLQVLTPQQHAERVGRHPEGHKRATERRSKYRSVYWDKRRQKWIVSVKKMYFGGFDQEADAGAVAADARRRLMPFSSS